MTRNQRKQIADVSTHPRFDGGDNWGGQLRIGFLIDWLDSRSDPAETESVRAVAKRNHAVGAAAMLSDRQDGPREALQFTPHNNHGDHGVEYGPTYHATIAGHLEPDEMPECEEAYRHLLTIEPHCLSAMANTAEFERQRGHLDRARSRLAAALSVADGSSASRYGVPDTSWLVHLRCALARMGVGDNGGARELLALASADDMDALVARLRGYNSWDAAAVPAHRAFADANRQERIVLRAAMGAAPINPRPPPSAHADREELDLAEARLLGSRG